MGSSGTAVRLSFALLDIPLIPFAIFLYFLVADNIPVALTISVVNCIPAVDTILLVADITTTVQ